MANNAHNTIHLIVNHFMSEVSNKPRSVLGPSRYFHFSNNFLCILLFGYQIFPHNIHDYTFFWMGTLLLLFAMLLLFAFQSMFISVWVSRLEIVEFPDDVCRSVP